MATKKAKTRKATKANVAKRASKKKTVAKKTATKRITKMDAARKVMKRMYPKHTRAEIIPVLIKEAGATEKGVHNYFHMIRTEMDKAARRKAPAAKRASKKKRSVSKKRTKKAA